VGLNRASLLMSGQETVARALGNGDVTVRFDATDEPSVDLANKIIHLRPLPTNLTDEEIENVRGDLDHEVGHIRHTNYDAFVVTATRSLLMRIANNIEDGRIERLMAEEWFGCGENLERSGRRAVARIKTAATPDLANRRARAVVGLGLLAYGDPYDFVIQSLGDDIAPLYGPVKNLLPRLAELKSTQEAVELATKIADAWKWRAADNRSDILKAVDPIALDADDVTSENEVDEEIKKHTTSVAEARKAAVAEIKTGALKLYRPKTAHDRVEDIQPFKCSPAEFKRLLTHFTKSVERIVPVLRRQLLMEFRGLGRIEVRDCRRGTFDERVAYRVALGDERVFYQEHHARVKRTAVTLLVDCSSSMSDPAREPAYKGEQAVLRTKLFVAAQAAAAMSWVLGLLGVPHECLAFTTARGHVGPDPNYERVRPLRHLIVKSYKRSYHSCRANFVSLALYEHCAENIDGEALLWAAQRLVTNTSGDASPTLIAFSDGDPASTPEEPNVLASHLLSVIKRVERAGIEVWGVEIASSSLTSFYKNRIVIRDVSMLVPELYKLLRRVLHDRVVID
jgi:hypothetical protein